MNIKEYILGGNCTFTVLSTKLGERYTYKIQKDKKHDGRYFCRVLYGPDNEKDYRYLGLFYSDSMKLTPSKRTAVDASGRRFKMLKYFLFYLYNDQPLPDTCKFYPSGRCARCGKKLTTPESIVRGFGPECWDTVMTEWLVRRYD